MNVIFILADDLGWSDTTLYGNTSLYKTPNLERLAKRGITFTQAYSASPLCSPTRASILTGQMPARTGFTAPAGHLEEAILHPFVKPGAAPGEKAIETESITRLDPAFPTLGKRVQAAGYSTAHFGKWHLGAEPYSPLQHGFDVDIPHWPGPGPAGSYVAPWRFSASPQSSGFKENSPKEHIEDRMAEEAVHWMKAQREKPFYMNYWMFSVHAPFDAKAELIEKYRKETAPDDPQRSPVYAAMVESMDDAVGSLLDAVDRAGIADRTAIVFISDNGGNMYDHVDHTSPTSNFPLRGGKGCPFEGGIRVPCVVVWPGITTPGSRSDAVIQTTDFYPTILNLLGIPLPENWKLDGIDITPALRGGTLDRDAIYTYFPHAPQAVPDWLPPSVSIRAGDWKLIRLFWQGENGAHDYRLYHLKDDIGETNNLAAAYPEKVRMMDQMMEAYLQKSNAVVPQPNPKFNPKLYMPENIGVPAAKQKAAGLVEGWVASGTCSIEKGDGTLVVASTGGDPYLFVHQFNALNGGPFTVSLKMKSDSSGGSMVYYNTPAAAARTVPFRVLHDGQWHEYDVKLPVSRLDGLRLDPSGAPGRLEIEWIRLKDSAGQTVQAWTF
jgi:arylsulfatase A-like enzyme